MLRLRRTYLLAALVLFPLPLLAQTAAPIVDLQSTTRQSVLTQDIIDALPAPVSPSQKPFAATYFLNQTYSIEGTLARVLTRASGSLLDIVVNAAAGTERWSGECANLFLGRMFRRDLRPGEHIIVTGSPGRNPDAHHLLIRSVSRPDGSRWEGGCEGGRLQVLLPGVNR